jgi:hypothetical protein
VTTDQRLASLENKLDAIGNVLANLARCLVVADHHDVHARDERLESSVEALLVAVSSPWQPVAKQG